MYYHHIIQKVVPFVLTFAVSALLVTTLQSLLPLSSGVEDVRRGSAYGTGTGAEGLTPNDPLGPNTPLRVTFQPKAVYTDAARANNVQGAVRLKITLRADGTVGPITTVTGLPDGLTEQAIAAARKIKFEPKRINGQPVSFVVTREYTFTIY